MSRKRRGALMDSDLIGVSTKNGHNDPEPRILPRKDSFNGDSMEVAVDPAVDPGIPPVPDSGSSKGRRGSLSIASAKLRKIFNEKRSNSVTSTMIKSVLSPSFKHRISQRKDKIRIRVTVIAPDGNKRQVRFHLLIALLINGLE